MREVRITSIDDRGRIVIPMVIRKSLGITTGSEIMIIADSEKKEIKITPVGLKGDSLKYMIKMFDHAGSLAKIATAFGNHGISLVYGESTIIEKDKTALWTVIGPKPTDLDIESLKEMLRKEGDALDVEIIPLD